MQVLKNRDKGLRLRLSRRMWPFLVIPGKQPLGGEGPAMCLNLQTFAHNPTGLHAVSELKLGEAEVFLYITFNKELH